MRKAKMVHKKKTRSYKLVIKGLKPKEKDLLLEFLMSHRFLSLDLHDQLFDKKTHKPIIHKE